MSGIYDNFSSSLHDILVSSGANSQYCAIGFTEAPLVWQDDHYEREIADQTRMPLLFSASAIQGVPANYGTTFTLATSILRTGAFGEYYGYDIYTLAFWNANSSSGNEMYPDAGFDYILQSTPSTHARLDDTLGVSYTASTSGNNYYRYCGSAYHVGWAVKDDPFGYAQMSKAVLYSQTRQLKTNATRYRTINSYYVHTWKTLNIGVDFSVSSDKTVSFNITPTIANKSWTLYSYATVQI